MSKLNPDHIHGGNRNFPVKVHVFVLCWNEIKILPFVVDYWYQFADHVYVCDNYSDDGSYEYLKQFDWITVERFNSDNSFNDEKQILIKNNVWKISRGKADFVVVCDMDEVLISNNLMSELQYMKDNDYNVLVNKWYQFFSDRFPVYKKGFLLHERYPYANESGAKVLLFDPNKINDMNFLPGQHEYVCDSEEVKYVSDKIFVLHIEKNLGLKYKLNRTIELKKRLSKTNIDKLYGVHYLFPKQRLIDDYNDAKNKKINFKEIVCNS